jgi:hypothetical protein
MDNETKNSESSEDKDKPEGILGNNKGLSPTLTL